jgi:hypothetical protein
LVLHFFLSYDALSICHTSCDISTRSYTTKYPVGQCLHKLGSISVAYTLRALSDDKSLAIFNIVAFTLPQDTSLAMNRLGLTKRQYNSRMNRLIKASLVIRKGGKYSPTSLGKVVYESHKLIGQASTQIVNDRRNDSWKQVD